MDKMIYLISLCLTFLQIARDGLVIFYKMMVEKFTWIIKNVKKPLRTTLEMIAYWLVMILFAIVLILMMGLGLLMGSIQDFYDCFFRKKYPIKRQLFLSTSCRMCKIM